MKNLNTLLIFFFSMPVIACISCSVIKSDSTMDEPVQPITSLDQFNNIIENSGNQLIAFDLFANWCMPCHVLAPTLDEVARENRSKVTMYKVDTDQFPQITAAFNVTGIPFVVFVKNKKALYALIGVQPKESYVKIINTYADTSSEMEMKPNGKKIEGIRINLPFFFVKNGVPEFTPVIRMPGRKSSFSR
jgi:thioredoxin 1